MCSEAWDSEASKRWADWKASIRGAKSVVAGAGPFEAANVWSNGDGSALCSFWPGRAKKVYRGPWNKPTNNRTILVLGNRFDPSTPLVNSVVMANDVLHAARGITCDWVGHGTFPAMIEAPQNSCLTSYITGERESLLGPRSLFYVLAYVCMWCPSLVCNNEYAMYTYAATCARSFCLSIYFEVTILNTSLLRVLPQCHSSAIRRVLQILPMVDIFQGKCGIQLKEQARTSPSGWMMTSGISCTRRQAMHSQSLRYILADLMKRILRYECPAIHPGMRGCPSSHS